MADESNGVQQGPCGWPARSSANCRRGIQIPVSSGAGRISAALASNTRKLALRTSGLWCALGYQARRR